MPLKQIKRKLTSQSGASMLLAMVFLMFCLFVGGSVLAAATANAGRVESLKHNQQLYLSQRSAMQLMADLLKSTPESQLQLTIKDVTVTVGNGTPTRTVTYTIHNNTGDNTVVKKSIFQKLLYETAISRYEEKYPTPDGVSISSRQFVNFLFEGQSGNYEQNIWNEDEATFSISASLNVGGEGTSQQEAMQAKYTITKNVDSQVAMESDFQITFVDGEATSSYMNLYMKSYYDEGKPVTVTVKDLETKVVTTTITRTTVIRWDDPVINKGGA